MGSLLDIILIFFPLSREREKCVYLKQNALLMEHIFIKNKTCIVDERRNSFDFNNIVLRIYPFQV